MALDKLGFTSQFAADLPLPFSVAGAICFKHQAQFHPLKFAAAIAKGLPIFEHTKVLELTPGKAVTSGGTISASKIIVATHFPIFNKYGGYFVNYGKQPFVIAIMVIILLAGTVVDHLAKEEKKDSKGQKEQGTQQ